MARSRPESMYQLETVNLSHRYRRNEQTLDRLCLQVPKGSIFGFLGPNGAGKTTTLRLVLGLLKVQSGEVRIDGQSTTTKSRTWLRSVGSMIESPSVYGHLTADENLQLWRAIYRCSENRVAEVLEIVGLSDTKNKLASQFSLGMKQRLGIAIAILHEPSILILDEPTNGLDPNGIVEIRLLLQRLHGSFNTTIVVSRFPSEWGS